MDIPNFESNDDYLEWELGRLRRRLSAYAEARTDPAQLDVYFDLVNTLDVERIEGIQLRREAIARGVAIPFDGMSRRFGLRPIDEDLLLACVSPHLSSAIWGLLQFAQGNALKPYLDVGFVAELFCPTNGLRTDTSWCEAPSALIQAGLLTVDALPQSGGPSGLSGSMLDRRVSVPPYIAAALDDRVAVDHNIGSFCRLKKSSIRLYDVVMSEGLRSQVEEVRRNLVPGGQRGATHWLIVIAGPRQTGKTMLVDALANELKLAHFVLEVDQAPDGDQAPPMITTALKNAAFHRALFHVVYPDRMAEAANDMSGCILRAVTDYPGTVVLECTNYAAISRQLAGYVHLSIEMEPPELESREQIWEMCLPGDIGIADDVNIPDLASGFELTGGQIKTAAAWAAARARTRNAQEPVFCQTDLLASAKSQIRANLESFAEVTRTRLGFPDVILSEETLETVREFYDACRHRLSVLDKWGFRRRLTTGMGLVALFTGDAGVGKTLCAEVLANELGMNLSMVTVPKIVSKWVGETEKNLKEIFIRARAEGTMLLFDEADSLFAKRVSVERAQDQNQNMEVNVLLQEIERFSGIVILTTNLDTNIDRAFQRRILFKVSFGPPGPKERERIWKVLLPKEVPLVEPIAFDKIAETYDLTGGQIKNALVRAAYRSFARSTGLTQDELVRCAQLELTSAGRLAVPMAVSVSKRP